MATATKRRTRTAPTVGSVLGDYLRAGHTLHMIGEAQVIHTGTVEEDGETFVIALLVELAGQPDKLGIVQASSTTRDRWMVSDGNGWLDAEFGTILAAVEALYSPKVRAQMQEQTNLRRELAALRQRVESLPAIPGAVSRS